MILKKCILFIFCALGLTACFKDTTIPPDQLSIETQNIDNLLSTNQTDYVVYTNSSDGSSNGIRMAVHSFGEGTIPHSGQNVKFTYQGKILSNLSVVDTGTYEGPLTSIAMFGLRSGIGTLPTGSKSSIYIASPYAYGSSGKGQIPGNTTLVYEVNLISVTRSTAEQTQFKKDSAVIQQYLLDSNITTAVLHSSGIWYDIITEGTGSSPRVYDRITIDYKGSMLPTGKIFQQSALYAESLYGLIDGFRVGIPLLKQGSKAVLYIPSGLAYGTSSAGIIPANTPLIFEVTLNSFSK